MQEESEKAMAKILVTGSHGFIGQYLCRELVKEHQLEMVDLKCGTDLFQKLPPGKFDYIYHLAAQTDVQQSIRQPEKDAYKNIIGSILIAKAYPDTKIIYTGSAASVGRKILSPYGLSKKTGAEYLKLLHNNVVICNLPNVFGKGGKGVIEIFRQDKELLIFGDGKQTRDFVHVEDIVRGLVQAINWPKGEYFMGSNTETTVVELAKATKKRIQFLPARKGELLRSKVGNTTPNWEPTINPLKYIKS